MKGYLLIDKVTSLATKGHTSSQPPLCLTLLPPTAYQYEFHAILQDFPAVLQANLHHPIKHNVTHHIQTTGPPVYSATRRLSPDKLIIAKKEFQNMLQLGIIRPSSSSWASPLHMVRRSLGTGILVVTTGHSVELLSLIDTQYHTSRILLFPSMVLLCFPNWTWFGLTTKFHLNHPTFSRLQLRHRLDFLSSLVCHLD